MKKVIVFGFGYNGWQCYMKLKALGDYKLIGFADNSISKQGKLAFGYPILSMDELQQINKEDIFVVIACNAWREVGIELERRKIPVKAIWVNGHLEKYVSSLTFDKIKFEKPVRLYAGNIYDDLRMIDDCTYGLSINGPDIKHIHHDITKPYPIPDSCVDFYEAEDVFEHIPFEDIPKVLNEIWRILKPDALFRLSMPDYGRPDIYDCGVMTDLEGKILYDPSGGVYENGKVIGGGHVWFPTYEKVRNILESSKFDCFDFLCFYDENGKLNMKNIDYTKGHVHRVETPIYGIGTMIIDLYK